MLLPAYCAPTFYLIALFELSLGGDLDFLSRVFDEDNVGAASNPLLKYYLRYDGTYTNTKIYHEPFQSFLEVQKAYDIFSNYFASSFLSFSALLVRQDVIQVLLQALETEEHGKPLIS